MMFFSSKTSANDGLNKSSLSNPIEETKHLDTLENTSASLTNNNELIKSMERGDVINKNEGFIQSIFANNPYFSAGFGLIGVTAGLTLLKNGMKYGLMFAERRVLVKMEITSKDPSYNWFLQWMGENTKRHAHELAVETSFTRRDNGSSFANFSLVPGPGIHYFKYNKCWYKVERQRERNMIDLKSGSPWETISITTLSRDRQSLSEILEKAKKAALSKEEGKLVIFTSYGPDWRPFGNPRKRRPLKSVVLESGISDKIKTDLLSFLNGSKWYYDRGIPYRRGYLLYGPPGSGKSSYIQALAGDLDYNICLLNMSERGMTDDRLAHLLSHTPPKTLILLEDIDAAFPSRVPLHNSNQGNEAINVQRTTPTMVTFSGLLNALDGVASAEERIIFMTTNHLERLDPALIRPGRVDMKVFVGNATEEQSIRLFRHFYPDATENDILTFSRNIAPLIGRVSPAQLQGFFVLNRDDCTKAAVNAGHICDEM